MTAGYTRKLDMLRMPVRDSSSFVYVFPLTGITIGRPIFRLRGVDVELIRNGGGTNNAGL